ncbi:phosphonate ABC transporter, permease protein PhnE [soil metagenome]
MTASVKAPTRPPAERPKKPGPTLFAILGALFAVGLTLATGLDWEYGIGFSVGDVLSNLTRRNLVFVGLLNTDLSILLSANTLAAFLETVQMAVIASIAGALVGLPLALLNSPIGSPNRATYQVVKGFNNVVRSVPDLLYALVFVAAVGGGTLPGMMALFLFSIAVVAKLTSDIVDGIDMGPVESAMASGAGHFQMVRTAILPQILPGYTSFSLYTFELNLRASAVLGFVGAGGVGRLLDAFRGRAWYDRVWGIVFGFFIVVFVIERISMALRRRLV